MRLTSLFLGVLGLLAVHAQQDTSPATASRTDAAASTTTTSGNINASQFVTTILTTISPTSSGAAPITTSFILTIGLNTTLSSPSLANSSTSTTFPNGTTIYNNGTTVYADGTKVVSNGTIISADGTTIVNGTAEVWNGTQNWLPFKIRLDGAYGAGGAVLILSGGFVGVLGGKHRWSSMAIVSGYSVLLFTLVLILRFGVEAKLAPPSPQYPGATERGLYCLACIVAAIIGSGIGLFFYKYTRYWVCAMGGFALGWFIMACKAGGVTGNSIVGRWGLMGGLSVVSFIAGLLPRWHHHLLLISTAFIGSTALTLGIDCFTRAGLKEFYCFNLGFRDLFPKVEGYKYPLLTIMQVELGVLAACFCIGTAIQYRVLGKLQVKVQQVKAEEEARRAAREEEQAASRFKTVEADREKWEGKYGNKKGQYAAMEEGLPLATLAKDGRMDSAASLMRRTTSAYEHQSNGAQSPTSHPDGESAHSNLLPQIQLGDSIAAAPGAISAEGGSSPMGVTAEEAERMRLLKEIEDTKKSIDVLRSSTPASSVAFFDRPLSSAAPFDTARLRRESAVTQGSRLSTYAPNVKPPMPPADDTHNREWQEYLADRKLFTPPSGVTPPIEASFGRLSKVPDSVVDAINRRERTVSAYELGSNLATESASPVESQMPRPSSTTPYSRRATSLDMLAVPPPIRPMAAVTLPRPQSGSRPPPIITGHAHSPLLRKSSDTPGATMVQKDDAHRSSITFEELGARHRARLSKLQQPVTEELQNSVQLADVKARYDRNREVEKRAAVKKEAMISGAAPTLGPRLPSATETRQPGETSPRTSTSRAPASEMLAQIPQESGLTKAAQWTLRQAEEPPSGRQRGDAERRPAERPPPGKKRYSSGPNRVVN